MFTTLKGKNNKLNARKNMCFRKLFVNVIKSKNKIILNFFYQLKQFFLLIYLLLILTNTRLLAEIIISIKKLFYN